MVVKLAFLIFMALMSVAQAKPLLVDDGQIAVVKHNAKLVRSLKQKCNEELLSPSHAVADFAPQPHYSKQGPNPDDDQAKALTSDIRAAYRGALCYRLTDQTIYAQHAQMLMDAWASTMKSASNAQGSADINFNIAQFVIAASWVEHVNAWNAKPFMQWLRAVITPLSHADQPNNHGNWGVLLDLSIAFFTQDQAAISKSYLRWGELILSQVVEDGTMPLEMCRSNTSDHCGGPDKGINGLAYTHFALLPAILAAELLHKQELEAYDTPAGQKMIAALRKSALFTAMPSKFPYFTSNHGQLNKIDHCGYFALALTHFSDENARAVLNAGKCKSDIWMLQKLYAQ